MTRLVSTFGLATGSPMRLSKPGCSIGLPSARRESKIRLGEKLADFVHVHGLILILLHRKKKSALATWTGGDHTLVIPRAVGKGVAF